MNNIVTVKEKCTGCGICSCKCPRDAITLKPNQFGFYYPSIQEDLCTECGICLKECHLNAQKPINLFNSRKYFGYTLDETLRRRSSSGGLFAAIARNFPDAVIVGAEYLKEDKRVKHTAGDISRLRRSKYVESNMEDAPKLAEEGLKKGKTVIFCGTPCQTAGMRKLFGEDENLVLIDFLCHGVPSMQFLNEHIHYIENKTHKKIDDINFRSKTQGWSNQGVLYYFEDGTREFVTPISDSYLFGFFKNISLRNACYDCHYINKTHADITLGDFWGVYKYNKALNDEKGISLCFVNTLKGEKIIEEIGEDIFIKELSNEDIKYISHRDYSSYKLLNEKFKQKYLKSGFEAAIKKFSNKNRWKSIIKDKVKRFLRT